MAAFGWARCPNAQYVTFFSGQPLIKFAVCWGLGSNWPTTFFYCLRAQISIIFCDKRALKDISLVPIKSDSGWSTIKLKFIWVSGSRSRFFMWFMASRKCSIMSVLGSSKACCKENGIFCQFLDAKTDVLLVFGSRNWQTMSVYVLDQETDITD